MHNADSATFGNFKFIETSIEGVIIVEPLVYPDGRGWFMETYKKSDFNAAGISCEFVQDNQSRSCKGVLRGLHYQKRYPQAKLVRVTLGEVFDVCVDLRKGSPTFGKWESAVLSSRNHRQLFIPKGFAHGFLALSDFVELNYKCDNEYHPHDEAGIIWDDPTIGIQWPPLDGDDNLDTSKIILSTKDRFNPMLPAE